MLSQNISESDRTPVDGAVILGAFAGFVISWIGVKRFHVGGNADAARLQLQHRIHFWVPLAFSVALLFQGFSNCFFVYGDLQGSIRPPFGGMLMILGTYIALLTGIFLLPRSALAGKVALRFMMDSLTLIATIITFSWYFLLGPILLQIQGIPVIAVVVIASYAVFDLLIISCLILLSRSIVDHSLRGAFRGLSLSLVIFVVMDSFLLFQSLHSIPNTVWLNLGWIGGNFIIALSLQAMRWQNANTTTTDAALSRPSELAATPIWRSLLSYLLIPAAFVLVLFLLAKDRSDPLAIGTYACCLLLLGIVFAKQMVVIREVHGLNQGFQSLQHALDEKNTALEHANARLEALATTDPLTELPNHRAVITALDQELVRCQQYQRNCSLLFFDLDHFKALNDGYGHAGGDVALCEFGSLLRQKLPVINIVGRLGGEEFIAILPEKNATEAVAIAEELRHAVASHSFTIGGGMLLTCSIGVAAFPAHALQPKALLQAADSAMYGAKRLGRNQVRLVDDPAVIALLATNSAVEGRDEVTLIGTVHALALLVEKRDVQTGEHAQHVGELLLHLAESLDLSEAEAQLLSLAGQLHDVGKIVIPDSILQKEGPLTEQEIACIHQHPQVGAEVVSFIPSLRPIAPIIHAHHEWWNGMGYPDRLAGEAIPLGARMLSVVDAYVVMTAKHPHDPAYAIAELRQGAGTQFDPSVVKQFLLLLATMQPSREEVRMA